jgi:hypothetical protein
MRRPSPWTVLDRSRVGLRGDTSTSLVRDVEENKVDWVISDAGAVARRTVGGADIRLGMTSFSVSTSVVSASNTSSSVSAGVGGVDEYSD